MGYIEDAERLIEHVKQIKQTGASATQEQANPPADIGIFADGVYPYVYGMGVKIGMRERDPNGKVYVAIQAMTKQLNPPSKLAAIFQIEG